MRIHTDSGTYERPPLAFGDPVVTVGTAILDASCALVKSPVAVDVTFVFADRTEQHRFSVGRGIVLSGMGGSRHCPSIGDQRI